MLHDSLGRKSTRTADTKTTEMLTYYLPHGKQIYNTVFTEM